MKPVPQCARLTTAVLLAVFVTATGACGERQATAPPWRANAEGALAQLQQDVAATATSGATLAEARQALHHDSTLYVLLMAYSDLGGCRSMIHKVGAPAELETALALPCPRFERAAATFTRATSGDDPRALLRATRQAHLGEPLLVRALLAVHRSS